MIIFLVLHPVYMIIFLVLHPVYMISFLVLHPVYMIIFLELHPVYTFKGCLSGYWKVDVAFSIILQTLSDVVICAALTLWWISKPKTRDNSSATWI